MHSILQDFGACESILTESIYLIGQARCTHIFSFYDHPLIYLLKTDKDKNYLAYWYDCERRSGFYYETFWYVPLTDKLLVGIATKTVDLYSILTSGEVLSIEQKSIDREIISTFANIFKPSEDQELPDKGIFLSTHNFFDPIED